VTVDNPRTLCSKARQIELDAELGLIQLQLDFSPVSWGTLKRRLGQDADKNGNAEQKTEMNQFPCCRPLKTTKALQRTR